MALECAYDEDGTRADWIITDSATGDTTPVCDAHMPGLIPVLIVTTFGRLGVPTEAIEDYLDTLKEQVLGAFQSVQLVQPEDVREPGPSIPLTEANGPTQEPKSANGTGPAKAKETEQTQGAQTAAADGG